jgi:predicted Zn-dependent protease
MTIVNQKMARVEQGVARPDDRFATAAMLLGIASMLLLMAAGCVPEARKQLGRVQGAIGMAYGAAGQYPQMLAECQQALQKAPTDRDALRCVADAQYNLKQWDAAQRSYKRYLRAYPRDEQVRISLVHTLLLAEQPKLAKMELDVLLAQNPNSAKGWRYLGLAEAQLDSCKRSTIAYEKAYKLNDQFSYSLYKNSKMGRCKAESRAVVARKTSPRKTRSKKTRRSSRPRTSSRTAVRTVSAAPAKPVAAAPAKPAPDPTEVKTDPGAFPDHAPGPAED